MIQPDDARHGTTRGFHAGCKETCCRRAMNRYEKGCKARRYSGETWQIPALGLQRRIRALMRLGWTGTDIAAACGWNHRNSVRRILVGQKGKPCTWVERKTYHTLAGVYERLSMTIPPHAPHRARTRTRATRAGWPPPLAWEDIDSPAARPAATTDRPGRNRDDLDPVVVDRLVAGEHVPSTRAERDEAMRRWRAAGRSERSLCELFGWHEGRYGKDAA